MGTELPYYLFNFFAYPNLIFSQEQGDGLCPKYFLLKCGFQFII
jgi:hypothetical protein